MSDLISRNKLYEYALNQKDKAVTPNDIMRFPSAESRKGKWIKDDAGCVVCSLCGNSAEINCISGEFMESNYCSECGADMREEGYFKKGYVF